MTRPDDAAGAAFQISVTPSGRTFQSQGDENHLAAAIRSGVGLPRCCSDGACGSCKRKISGLGHPRRPPGQGAER